MFGAIIGGVLGLAQMGIGLAQQAKAKKERERLKADRPRAEVPEAAKRAVKIMGQRAAAGMAGYNQALQQLQQNKANTIRRLREGARGPQDLMNAAAAVQGGSDDSIINLNTVNAQEKRAAEGQYAGALGQLAQWQDRATDWNEREPYRRDMAEENQRMNTGMQTMFSGMDSLGSAAVLGTENMQFGNKSAAAPQVNTPVPAQMMEGAWDDTADMFTPQDGGGANMGTPWAQSMMPVQQGQAFNQPAAQMNPWAQQMMPAQGQQFSVAPAGGNPYALPNDPIGGVMGQYNSRGSGFSNGFKINPYSAAGRMLNLNPFQ